MTFTPNILQQAGKDFCNALLSYYHQKNMIVMIPSNSGNSNDLKNEEKSPVKNNNSNLKIFSFDHENLLEEIEAVKEIIKEENGEDGDEDKEKGNNSKLSDKEASDGSDSEPSLDNFENDELVKLLPSLPKKKSKFIF